MIITIPNDAAKVVTDATHAVVGVSKSIAKTAMSGAKKGKELGQKLGSGVKRTALYFFGALCSIPGTKIEIKLIRPEKKAEDKTIIS